MYNNPKPRVLVVSYPYLPIVGGLSQQAHLLNRALHGNGVIATVATQRVEGYPSHDILDNVHIYRLWTFRNRPTGYRFRYYSWLLSLTAFLFFRQHDYDVIHVHQALHHAAICVILGKILRKPTLIRVTGSGDSGNIAILKKWWWLGSLVLFIIRCSDCFVSLSDDITSELLRVGIPREKIEHIDNGIDTTFFTPISVATDTSTFKTVLGVGRLSNEKGFDILVRAWPKIIKEEPNARLVIVGDGIEMQNLKSLAQQLEVTSMISFEGNQKDVLDYLSTADVFVLPSRNEGMSNALLEAMSMERACVASNLPANIAVLTPFVDGLLFVKNDSENLSEQIVRLLRDPHFRKRLGVNARQKIIKRFSIDIIATRYVELYLRLLS